tara:strand:- start:39 stop:233 length:195 start_codon:yes stop_codon:yes gene_type:complete
MDQNKLELELRTHEVQCEERWKTTFHRLESLEGTIERMEGRMLGVAGVLIMFLAGIVITLAGMQ